MIVGGLLLWGALHYHLIQSKQGFHLIPKTSTSLAKTYVDIRSFTVADWAKNTDLAFALTQANQFELIQNAPGDALQNGLDRLLDGNQQR